MRCAGVLVQVPLTYRDAPLPDAANSVGTMQHSVLVERWVHDGLADPVFVNALPAATLTGCGQAIGMVEHDGRSVVVPPGVHLAGAGWTGARVPVDGLVQHTDDDHWAVLRNDQFELRWARRPVPGDRPPIGLTATWPGHEVPSCCPRLAFGVTSEAVGTRWRPGRVRPGVEQLASAVAPAHDRRDSPGRYNKLTSTLRLQQDLRVATWITRQGGLQAPPCGSAAGTSVDDHARVDATCVAGITTTQQDRCL